MRDSVLKTKPLRWETILFLFANFACMSTFLLFFIIFALISIFTINQAGNIVDFIFSTMFFTLPLMIAPIVLKNLYIYFALEKINKDGCCEFKIFVGNLKKSYKIKTLCLILALCVDYLFSLVLSIIVSDTNMVSLYFISSSLFFSYLCAFILFGIGDWVKKIRSRAHHCSG